MPRVSECNERNPRLESKYTSDAEGVEQMSGGVRPLQGRKPYWIADLGMLSLCSFSLGFIVSRRWRPRHYGSTIYDMNLNVFPDLVNDRCVALSVEMI